MTRQERLERIAGAGGLAFPRPGDDFNGGSGQEDGMTLRDFFAAAALTGLLARGPGGGEGGRPGRVAGEAYRMADAVLAARDLKPAGDVE